MKYFLMIFISVLLLTACGTSEEDSAEEDVAENDEAEAEESTGSADESGEAAEEEETEGADEEETETADVEQTRNVDFSVMEMPLTDREGSEMTSMLELNAELVEMLDGASESNADVSEVLKPAEDLTTYYSESFVAIHVFRGDSSEPLNSDVEGINAEMDVRDGTEAYSEYYNTATGEFEEHLYRDEEGYYEFDGTQWTDAPEISKDEDIYYGSYSNLYEAFMETEDVINVSEDDDYYYLHNVGTEEVLHETFGSVFNVEYTGADETAMENAVVAAVDKSTGELDELLYVTTAPSAQGNDYLQIEVATSFDGYGAFDGEGVTAPDIEEDGSTEEDSSSIDRAPDSVDFSLTEEQFNDDSGTEMTSILSMNAPVPGMLDDAVQTDEEMQNLLTAKDDITTYYGETFMVVDVFDGVNSEPFQSDTVGLIAELDEGEDMEVYSEIHEPSSDEFTPHHYGNSEIVYAYQDGLWTEDTSGTTAEEVFHATYSNIHDAFIEVEEVIEVAEDDEYYYLYNIGNEMVLHDVFGDMFEVEYTGADEDAMENAVIGIIDKTQGDFVHLTYISTAPSQSSDEYIQIEAAASYGDYGAYDDSGITVPDIYE